MIIAFLGAPGTGKGTISEIVAKELGMVHISAGDLIRNEVTKKTKIGIKLKDYEEHGLLAPANLVNELISKAIKKNKKFDIILDGYPRQIQQAYYLDKNHKISIVIKLCAKESIIIDRLSNRRICPNGHIYHLKNIPPKKKGICDIDGLKLIQRPDDNPKAIKTRLELFEKETEPAINYYKKQKLYKLVRAEGKADSIASRVIKIIKNLG